MNILVINAGSSSLKYQLIDIDNKNVLAKGNCERIGIDGKFKHKTFDGRKIEKEMTLNDHKTAFQTVISAITEGDAAVIGSVKEIDAVGHRIVNGGDRFSKSVLVTDQVLKDFEEVINFAPLHNPPAMTGIKACLEILGKDVPNVLVFDTAFHQTMPPKAYIFGVPYEYYEKYKLRRYGAHGTSHRYVSLRVAELMGKKPEELKVVTCHLGNGSSISAVDGGKCIDTSMGFTPLGGIIMGTRSGDLDPSVVTFIMEKEGLSPREMERILNKESGFIGISGISSDDRDLEEATAKGIERSIIAQDAQRYQIKKYIGAYSAAMGGIDALVFTGGIGENSCLLREAVCSNMEYLGIKIDKDLNNSTIRGKEGDISTPDAKVRTYVIPTNEEYMIALDTKNIVESLKK
ncbi:Acetate kinase [[Clostridium] cellulosi]|uniref:Acetate kinase n=1 Tax=[Clostridium] cellulosi TaxID=29343 RepID=A0A078KPM4_9FIRM|nr:Acetate kinase [[Clostridium] cellulosi]